MNDPAVDLLLVEGGASSRILKRFIHIGLADRREYLRLAAILAAVTWVPRALLIPLVLTQFSIHDVIQILAKVLF
jgi:hypothetical protein